MLASTFLPLPFVFNFVLGGPLFRLAAASPLTVALATRAAPLNLAPGIALPAASSAPSVPAATAVQAFPNVGGTAGADAALVSAIGALQGTASKCVGVANVFMSVLSLIENGLVVDAFPSNLILKLKSCTQTLASETNTATNTIAGVDVSNSADLAYLGSFASVFATQVTQFSTQTAMLQNTTSSFRAPLMPPLGDLVTATQHFTVTSANCINPTALASAVAGLSAVVASLG